MAAQNVKLAGKQFVIVPKKEYARLKQSAQDAKPRRRRGGDHPEIESYSDARVAEFLLSNSVDAADYVDAVKQVRAMGLDPANIPHHKPAGVK